VGRVHGSTYPAGTTEGNVDGPNDNGGGRRSELSATSSRSRRRGTGRTSRPVSRRMRPTASTISRGSRRRSG